jgi:hypothetical protein
LHTKKEKEKEGQHTHTHTHLEISVIHASTMAVINCIYKLLKTFPCLILFEPSLMNLPKKKKKKEAKVVSTIALHDDDDDDVLHE